MWCNVHAWAAPRGEKVDDDETVGARVAQDVAVLIFAGDLLDFGHLLGWVGCVWMRGWMCLVLVDDVCALLCCCLITAADEKMRGEGGIWRLKIKDQDGENVSGLRKEHFFGFPGKQQKHNEQT